MRRDDVRFAVAAREDGLRRVRRLTFRIGAAGVACSAVIAVAFSHLSGSAAASGQASGTGTGQNAAGGSGGRGIRRGGATQQGGSQQGAARCRPRRRTWPRPRGRRRECRGVHDRSGRHRAGPRLAGRRCPAAAGRARGDRRHLVHPALVHHPGHRRGGARAADPRDGARPAHRRALRGPALAPVHHDRPAPEPVAAGAGVHRGARADHDHRQLRPDRPAGRVHAVHLPVPALLARARRGRARPAHRADRDQPDAGPARPPVLAAGALDGLPVLAGGGAARPGHRHRHPHPVGAGGHAAVRRGDRLPDRMAAGRRAGPRIRGSAWRAPSRWWPCWSRGAPGWSPARCGPAGRSTLGCPPSRHVTRAAP